MIKISQLFVYPVKSLAGIQLQEAELDSFGIKNDRRWMIVDEKGNFLSQRSHPKMAQIKTSFKNHQLKLSYQDQSVLVPKVNSENPEFKVTVWNDSFKAKMVGQVDVFLSKAIGTSCKLVYMNSSVQRQIDKDYAPINHHVSFADAFPFLLTSQESLDDLNQHLNQNAEMIRFRPNIVIEGVKAFAEDDFKALQINQTEFKAVKKCSRCIMPSQNPNTGIQDQAKILSTLIKFRKVGKKVFFGQNLIYKNPEIIENLSLKIGDEIILK